jgi:hypothetical protein
MNVLNVINLLFKLIALTTSIIFLLYQTISINELIIAYLDEFSLTHNQYYPDK